jgi:hypothetical protein
MNRLAGRLLNFALVCVVGLSVLVASGRAFDQSWEQRAGTTTITTTKPTVETSTMEERDDCSNRPSQEATCGNASFDGGGRRTIARDGRDRDLAGASGRSVREGTLGSVAQPPLDASATSVSAGRAESLRAIRLVFRSRAPAAIRVASCETGGTFDARAANWSDRHSDGSRGSFGLFQIGALHRDKGRGESVAAFARRMFDPVANSRVAYRMSRGGTRWRAWSCRWAA